MKIVPTRQLWEIPMVGKFFFLSCIFLFVGLCTSRGSNSSPPGPESLARNSQFPPVTFLTLSNLRSAMLYIQSQRKPMTKYTCRPCGAPLVASPHSP